MGTPAPDIGVAMRQLVILLSLGLAVRAFDNAMQWLTDDLFNDQRYDKTLIPIEDAPMESGENAVSLGLGLSLRNIDMDAAGNLKVNAWLKATWKDYRLSWEPVEYEGIKKLNLPADMIWRPDISIYNQAFYNDDDADKQLRKSDYNTILTADGTVIWIPPVSFTVDCTYRTRGEIMTMENPAEEQDCHIMMGSWTQDALHMNLTAFRLTLSGETDESERIDMSDFSMNSPWIVTSQEARSIFTKKYECCPEPYNHVDFRFKVQRAYHIKDGKKIYDMDPGRIQKHIRAQTGNEEDSVFE